MLGKNIQFVKKVLFMTYYKIKHQVLGRLRVKVELANRNELYFALIERNLSSLSFVSFVRINSACNSIVVTYQKLKQSDSSFVKQILENINASAKQIMEMHNKNLHENKSINKILGLTSNIFKAVTNVKDDTNCNCNDVAKHGDLIKPAFMRFMALTSIFSLVFIKKVAFNAPISQALFSPLGIASVVFSVPLIKSGAKQLKQKKVSLDGFLGTGCIATAFSSQALAAFEILWINAGAELLTAWITERSRKSISNILQATSHHTFTLVDGVEVETKISDLKEGDIVVLHTGEKVCIDGEIINGHALLDESPISGRADLMQKSIGDMVLAGTFVSQGLIYVCAKQVGDQTYLSRVLCLVEDELANKASVEGLADKLAKRLIILGFVATGLTLLFTKSISRAFTVLLVMACPCATALSASTPISAAINIASKKNILIKGGRYLEEVGKVDCICFDKTGTLTISEPKLMEIVLLKDRIKNIPSSEIEAENILLKLVLSTEMHNHHPLAQAIKKEAEQRKISPFDHTCCEYFLGMGMMATVEGDEILVGNHKLMEHLGIEFDESMLIYTGKNFVFEQVKRLRMLGRTVLFVAKNKEIVALLAFDNPIRSEAKAVIETLKNTGIKNVYLITGDEENTARTLSKSLGIDGYFASVMPTEKSDIIKQLQTKYGSVLMVGDGINDAVALTQADVGIAMGAGGSEVAIEAADITLVNDDLCGIVYLHELSKKTINVVHQNFWLATSSNLAGVALGFFGIINPVLAGTLHIAHTLGVLASSSRLLSFEPEDGIMPCAKENSEILCKCKNITNKG